MHERTCNAPVLPVAYLGRDELPSPGFQETMWRRPSRTSETLLPSIEARDDPVPSGGRAYSQDGKSVVALCCPLRVVPSDSQVTPSASRNPATEHGVGEKGIVVRVVDDKLR
jgi:hypothetical protein